LVGGARKMQPRSRLKPGVKGGEAIEGPVELALHPAADDWEDAEEGSVPRGLWSL
jgi:hypothetical protein